jgi:putative sigma-54 modulation protein
MVHVKGKNINVTPALHAQVVAKMGRLDRFLDRLSTIDVELCVEKTRDVTHQNTVEATAHVPGRIIRVRACGEDMFTAIDEAVEKLYRQLNRKKERMKSHHGEKLAMLVADQIEREDMVSEENGAGSIVRVKQIDMKPEFEDEAVANMEELGHSFYVFLNAQSEQINVLYRRRDGNYGLIEPSVR